jgi:hypothetical protein
MFKKICIKDKQADGYRLDVAFLIDSMLFYGKVVLLVHREEIVILLKLFGENLLNELIATGRIEVKVRENILGSMIFPDGKYNVESWSSRDENVETILYQAHRELQNNSSKNLRFASEFSRKISSYAYPGTVRENIIADFNNEDYLTRALPVYLNSIVPQFVLPEKIEIEIVKDGQYGPFDAYTLNTNVNMVELNKIHKQQNPEAGYTIDYSGFLLSIAESKGDIQITSELESEIVTSELYSKFISLELDSIIAQRTRSENELNLFNIYVLEDCTSLGAAFVNGVLSGRELIKILEKSDRFRDWLGGIPEDNSLLGEYHKAAAKKEFADRLPTKTVRFVLFEGAGALIDMMGGGGLGTAAGTALAAADSFLLDKILNRAWKPNQFIDKTLKPKIKV